MSTQGGTIVCCTLHRGRENGMRAKGQNSHRIRGNCFPHSSRALSDATEAHNATAPDNLHANANNGLEAKLENEQTASRSHNSLV